MNNNLYKPWDQKLLSLQPGLPEAKYYIGVIKHAGFNIDKDKGECIDINISILSPLAYRGKQITKRYYISPDLSYANNYIKKFDRLIKQAGLQYSSEEELALAFIHLKKLHTKGIFVNVEVNTFKRPDGGTIKCYDINLVNQDQRLAIESTIPSELNQEKTDNSTKKQTNNPVINTVAHNNDNNNTEEDDNDDILDLLDNV